MDDMNATDARMLEHKNRRRLSFLVPPALSPADLQPGARYSLSAPDALDEVDEVLAVSQDDVETITTTNPAMPQTKNSNLTDRG